MTIHVTSDTGSVICDVEGCEQEATMAHGTIDAMMYTCNEHSGDIMLMIAQAIMADDEEGGSVIHGPEI